MVQAIKHFIPDYPFEKSIPRFVFAGILALALHLSFFLFSAKPEVHNDSEKNKKYVSLLPVNTSLLSEKKLLQWMKIMDPTIAVKPDRKNGFSVAPKVQQPSDIPLVINKHFLQVRKGNFMPLRLPIISLAEKYEKLWAYTPAPDFKIVNSLSKTISMPFFCFEDRNIPIVYFTDNDKNNIKTILTKNPQAIRKFTLLRIIYPKLASHPLNLNKTSKIIKKTSEDPFLRLPNSFVPRIQIVKSSGNEDLDRFAVKKLALLFSDNIIKTQYNDMFVTVKWN
jgi:hypothetical protein